MFKSRTKASPAATARGSDRDQASTAGAGPTGGIAAGEVADRMMRAGPPSIDALLSGAPAAPPVRRLPSDDGSERPRQGRKVADIEETPAGSANAAATGKPAAPAAGQPARLPPAKPDTSGLLYFKKRDEMVAVQRGAIIVTRHLKGDVRTHVATPRTLSAIGPLSPSTAAEITQAVVADLITEIDAAEEALARG